MLHRALNKKNADLFNGVERGAVTPDARADDDEVVVEAAADPRHRAIGRRRPRHRHRQNTPLRLIAARTRMSSPRATQPPCLMHLQMQTPLPMPTLPMQQPATGCVDM